jgi:hypothetical protein
VTALGLEIQPSFPRIVMKGNQPHPEYLSNSAICCVTYRAHLGTRRPFTPVLTYKDSQSCIRVSEKTLALGSSVNRGNGSSLCTKRKHLIFGGPRHESYYYLLRFALDP